MQFNTSGRVGVLFDLRPIADALDSAITNGRKMEILASGVRDALRPVQREASRKARQPGMAWYEKPRPGSPRAARKRLFEQIIIQARPYYESKKVLGLVGPRYSPFGGGANHGHLVEHGHRVANKGTLRRSGRNASKRPPRSKLGQPFAGNAAVIGQARAFPFLAPAVESTRLDVQRRFEKSVLRYINKALEKVGRNG